MLIITREGKWFKKYNWMKEILQFSLTHITFMCKVGTRKEYNRLNFPLFKRELFQNSIYQKYRIGYQRYLYSISKLNVSFSTSILILYYIKWNIARYIIKISKILKYLFRNSYIFDILQHLNLINSYHFLLFHINFVSRISPFGSD